MTDVYEHFDKAFSRVSAYIVMDKQGEVVAKIAFKFPAAGEGRLYAYVHWLGVPMVRGFAAGYGYDKRSAAVSNAQRKLMVREERDRAIFDSPRMKAFLAAIERDGGEYWDTRLRDAGFTVVQAV